MTLDQLHGGSAVRLATRTRAWRHPWCVRPVWTGARWHATVKAGFVNDNAPVFQTIVSTSAPAAEQDFGINPLTGQPFFSDPIFAKPEPGDASVRTVAIPLTLDPALPLVFRAVGWDAAAAGEAVPTYFIDRGAANFPQGTDPADLTDATDLADDLASSLNAPQDGPPPGLRLLRACDLILHQPRLALTSSIEIEPGLATGQTHVQQILSVASEVPGDTLRVLVGTFVPAEQAGIDPLTGDYTEPPYDELRIATVYLLSPPNTPPHSDPDGTWTAYVQHQLFWNLNYEPGVFRPPTVDPGIGEIPPLAFGVAQIVVNYFTSAISDILQDANNLITATSLAGSWWTPTGGGHLAALPAAPASSAQGATGLDKAGQIAAQNAAKRRAKATATLDPAYPYFGMPFPIELLTP